MLLITKVLKRSDDSIYGCMIQDSSSFYCAAVSVKKAKELGISDADYLEYMDYPVEYVKVTPDGRYGLISKAKAFLKEYQDTSFERQGDDEVILQGYLFDLYALCTVDSDIAISRLGLQEQEDEV